MNAKQKLCILLPNGKEPKLGAYDIAPGYGIYTDMNAIRADEELDNLHSLYVDQWDWEKTIREEDRNLEYLKDTVRKIYQAMRETEKKVFERFPHITPRLPEQITFIHSEDLRQMYPDLTPTQRESEITKNMVPFFLLV